MTHFRHIYDHVPATITIPPALRHRRVEVIILALDEPIPSGRTEAVDANGWPIGFFAETFGSIPDFPEREAQGQCEEREALA